MGLEGEPTPRALPVYATDPEAGGPGGNWAPSLGWAGTGPDHAEQDGDVGNAADHAGLGLPGALIAVPEGKMLESWSSNWAPPRRPRSVGTRGAQSWTLAGAHSHKDAMLALSALSLRPLAPSADQEPSGRAGEGHDDSEAHLDEWQEQLGSLGTAVIPGRCTAFATGSSPKAGTSANQDA